MPPRVSDDTSVLSLTRYFQYPVRSYCGQLGVLMTYLLPVMRVFSHLRAHVSFVFSLPSSSISPPDENEEVPAVIEPYNNNFVPVFLA